MIWRSATNFDSKLLPSLLDCLFGADSGKMELEDRITAAIENLSSTTNFFVTVGHFAFVLSVG